MTEPPLHDPVTAHLTVLGILENLLNGGDISDMKQLWPYPRFDGWPAGVLTAAIQTAIAAIRDAAGTLGITPQEWIQVRREEIVSNPPPI